MRTKETFNEKYLPENLYWFNEPKSWRCGNGLEIVTDRETDFWQRTHYGFSRDNGHCLLADFSTDFVLTTHVRFDPRSQYDQCGMMVRVDEDNWIKLSTEYENEAISRLGSVVTNSGYSDWATQDVSSAIEERWYRIKRQGQDFFLEASEDGYDWYQIRVTHLHNAGMTVAAGLYACSPIGEAFRCLFSCLEVEVKN
jgi:regulation of enolase protein 1 (concanavalin A-like superfamily)